MATLVAFDVVANDMGQAQAYAAALPALTGPAMLQCLQVQSIYTSNLRKLCCASLVACPKQPVYCT